MFFRQVYEEGLAQASYVLGCQENGEAMVVNPKRDVDTYLELAAAQDLRIVGVAETHVHADYLCGARELAAATGATLYLSDEGDADWKYRGLEGFKHVLLKDGDEIRLGNVRLKALHTPGHTPEHLSFLVTDGASSNQPGITLTGDFVFVGDLGRPDLLEEAVGVVGSAQIGAQQMFEGLQQSPGGGAQHDGGLRAALCLVGRAFAKGGPRAIWQSPFAGPTQGSHLLHPDEAAQPRWDAGSGQFTRAAAPRLQGASTASG